LTGRLVSQQGFTSIYSILGGIFDLYKIL
jgi:hypothetical protein